jgi:hypothetical protein
LEESREVQNRFLRPAPTPAAMALSVSRPTATGCESPPHPYALAVAPNGGGRRSPGPPAETTSGRLRHGPRCGVMGESGEAGASADAGRPRTCQSPFPISSRPCAGPQPFFSPSPKSPRPAPQPGRLAHRQGVPPVREDCQNQLAPSVACGGPEGTLPHACACLRCGGRCGRPRRGTQRKGTSAFFQRGAWWQGFGSWN